MHQQHHKIKTKSTAWYCLKQTAFHDNHVIIIHVPTKNQLSQGWHLTKIFNKTSSGLQMSAGEKSRARKKSRASKKTVAPAKKKAHQQKKKSRQQKKVASAKKSRATKKKVAPPKKQSRQQKKGASQLRKCAPEYHAVCTHVWCCTHTCLALTGLRGQILQLSIFILSQKKC